ncbi:MAG: translation elongation factor Ts [Chloroflexota bacterium]
MGTTSTELDDIKKLRDETGAGVMEAKRALQEAGGSYDKAKKHLETKGAAGAAKRSGRAAENGLIEAYIHAGGQIGSLVELNSETDFVSRMDEFKELAHEIALQIAATSPRYLTISDIPENEVNEMKEEFRKEAVAEGKPEQIAGRIADGKFKKYSAQVVLMDQPYVRDDSKTIGQLVQDLAAKTRENIVVRRFCRFQVGT